MASYGPTAGILVIGEEILSAKVDEQNARYLLCELRSLGVAVRRIEVIPDDVDEIATATASMSLRFDHVFTSGGVGPTHDDVTVAGVAKAFGQKLVRSPELEAKIRGAMGANLHERDLRMADIPEGSRLLYGPEGHHRWPVLSVNNVYLFPGVPQIFRIKFEMIREMFRTGPIYGRAIYCNECEGAIAGTLDAAVAACPEVFIGSYPRMDPSDHKVKVTIDGRDAAQVDRAFALLLNGLGDAVVRTE
jgi:molybdenum cofactor synthesis domain-containing protein